MTVERPQTDLSLDLTNLEASGVKYELVQYPDGQQDIKIDPLTTASTAVLIKSRLNNFLDLERIICASKALKRLNICSSLFIPYLLGARSDRQFQEGGTSYLVDVVAPIINSLNFKEVRTYDVHSDVAAACIKNLKTVPNLSLVTKAMDEIYSTEEASERRTVLVSPDGGALKKIHKVSQFIGVEDVITCTKSRNEADGKISKVRVPDAHLWAGGDFIIIDDICDGGRTFIEIAKIIKEITDRYTTSAGETKIYLIVTHGIFSKGYEDLAEYFTHVFCTNSIKELPDNLYYVPKGQAKAKAVTSFITQQNIFK